MHFFYKYIILVLFIILNNILFSQKNISINDTIKKEIVVGIKASPPFIIKNKTGEFSGVSIDLWEIIAKKLKLKYKFKVYKETEMSKMLSDLEKGNVDISINSLTVTGERIQKVDFTQPFYTSYLAIAVPIKHKNSLSESFNKIITKTNLIIIIIAVIIVGVIIWLLERKSNPKEFRKEVIGIGDGIWWAATILTSIGPATRAPRTFFGRIFGVFWMFIAIITISILIGSIASDLTAGKMKSDIDSINSLKQKKIGTISGTSCEQFLIKNFIPVENNNFTSIKEGLLAINDNLINAFVYDEPILKYLIFSNQMNDKLYILPYKLTTDYYSFALPKNSELTNKINTHIIQEIEKISWKATLNKYNLN